MDVAVVEFISASTAGIVNVELGFVPDFAIYIHGHGGTNPNIYLWANYVKFPRWAEALALLITGSTGVVTRDTTSIAAFAGGNKIATVETANSSPKHVDRDGTFAAAGHICAEGLAIPADHQTNSGANLLVAFRGDQ